MKGILARQDGGTGARAALAPPAGTGDRSGSPSTPARRQRHDLGVTQPAACIAWPLRQQIVRHAIDSDAKQVEVGVHRGLQVVDASAAPTSTCQTWTLATAKASVGARVVKVGSQGNVIAATNTALTDRWRRLPTKGSTR
jgi:hypothetical protein